MFATGSIVPVMHLASLESCCSQILLYPTQLNVRLQITHFTNIVVWLRDMVSNRITVPPTPCFSPPLPERYVQNRSPTYVPSPHKHRSATGKAPITAYWLVRYETAAILAWSRGSNALSTNPKKAPIVMGSRTSSVRRSWIHLRA